MFQQTILTLMCQKLMAKHAVRRFSVVLRSNPIQSEVKPSSQWRRSAHAAGQLSVRLPSSLPAEVACSAIEVPSSPKVSEKPYTRKKAPLHTNAVFEDFGSRTGSQQSTARVASQHIFVKKQLFIS